MSLEDYKVIFRAASSDQLEDVLEYAFQVVRGMSPAQTDDLWNWVLLQLLFDGSDDAFSLALDFQERRPTGNFTDDPYVGLFMLPYPRLFFERLREYQEGHPADAETTSRLLNSMQELYVERLKELVVFGMESEDEPILPDRFLRIWAKMDTVEAPNPLVEEYVDLLFQVFSKGWKREMLADFLTETEETSKYLFAAIRRFYTRISEYTDVPPWMRNFTGVDGGVPVPTSDLADVDANGDRLPEPPEVPEEERYDLAMTLQRIYALVPKSMRTLVQLAQETESAWEDEPEDRKELPIDVEETLSPEQREFDFMFLQTRMIPLETLRNIRILEGADQITEEEFRADMGFFRLFGPHNTNPYLFDETPYTGERMFLQMEYDPEDPDGPGLDWYDGYCEYCYRPIRRRRHAFRLPLMEGGWYGCFCSPNCALEERKATHPRDDVTPRLVEKIVTYLLRYGVQDYISTNE